MSETPPNVIAVVAALPTPEAPVPVPVPTSDNAVLREQMHSAAALSDQAKESASAALGIRTDEIARRLASLDASVKELREASASLLVARGVDAELLRSMSASIRGATLAIVGTVLSAATIAALSWLFSRLR